MTNFTCGILGRHHYYRLDLLWGFSDVAVVHLRAVPAVPPHLLDAELPLQGIHIITYNPDISRLITLLTYP